jgi:putative two-component system hydrogenase maturation factor HypX/HoxX
MGNLYGSEYWSYLLPKHAGIEHAQQISQARLPMGTEEAHRLGLVDQQFDCPHDSFLNTCKSEVDKLIHQPDFDQQLKQKRQQRRTDEQIRPLARYREAELEKMRLNFYGFDPSYHIARYNFVHKVAKSRTPTTIAFHRRPQRTAQS